MRALSTKHKALLAAMNDVPMNVSEAMRAGGYASRSAARKGLGKLLSLGYIKGEFGRMPEFGNDGKNAAFILSSDQTAKEK